MKCSVNRTHFNLCENSCHIENNKGIRIQRIKPKLSCCSEFPTCDFAQLTRPDYSIQGGGTKGRTMCVRSFENKS